MKKSKLNIILWIAITIVALLYIFFSCPNLNPLFIEGAAFWAILITAYIGVWLINYCGDISLDFAKGVKEPIDYDMKRNPPKAPIIVIIIPWLYIIVMVIVFSVLFQWKAYRDQIGVSENKVFSNEIQAVDLDELPVVDQSVAIRLAQTKLGERPSLGSQVEIKDATLQRVNGDLVWVVPLYHSGFFKWFANMSGAHGYVVVSATDMQDVRYVENQKVKIQPASYLHQNLKRYARFTGGLFTGLTDYSFEIDDDGTPYWIVTTYKNLKGFNLPEATGVHIINASTGENKKYKIEDVPEWVDRVQPVDFIIKQINNSGKYIRGIFNFSNRDKYKTSEGSMIVYNNKRNYLFTGITSVGSDESAIGFVMVDMKTKQYNLYSMSGATETYAQSSAQGKVQHLNYEASFPLILNVDAHPTYFMTLKDKAGLIKQYAFVNVSNYSIVGTGETVSDALRDYRKNLSGGGSVGQTDIAVTEDAKRTITGTVIRIGSDITSGETTYKLMVEGVEQYIFTETSSLSNKLALTQVGDTVTITYYETPGAMTTMLEFDNLDLPD